MIIVRRTGPEMLAEASSRHGDLKEYVLHDRAQTEVYVAVDGYAVMPVDVSWPELIPHRLPRLFFL